MPPLNVPQLSIEALLISIIRRLEALEGGSQPGESSGFFGFGESSKSNNMGEAGYDRAGDFLTAGGYLNVQTQGDSPNMVMKRQERDENNSTGWADNTTVGRFGWIAIDKNGNIFYDNGSDGEVAGIAGRIHIDDNGDTPLTAYSIITFNVVDSRVTNPLLKAPFNALEVNGQNGCSVVAHCRNSDGSIKTVVLAEADF